MRTFPVSNVTINRDVRRAVPIATALQARIKLTPEAAGADADSVVEAEPIHGLIATVHASFMAHHPLVLTPDAIWLCIAQGFADHVTRNAEQLRGQFVRHEGKLEVTRHGFSKGSPDNDWPGVFREFSDTIAEHVGKQRDLVVCDFSTTTPISRAVSEISLLDAVQSYFRYNVMTLCGIPEITLLGTVDDWKSVYSRAAALSEYDLRWWTDGLLPVLHEFVRAAEGHVDQAFWSSLYKWQNASGGDEITGHINVLFPYLTDWNTGELMLKLEGEALRYAGTKLDMFPSGLSRAPFTWRYLDQTFDMAFIGGFAGVAQEATGALRPALGWAVVDTTQAP